MVPLKRDGCVCVYMGGGGSQDKRARQCSRRTNCPPKSRSLHSARTLGEKTRRGGMGGDHLCHRESLTLQGGYMQHHSPRASHLSREGLVVCASWAIVPKKCLLDAGWQIWGDGPWSPQWMNNTKNRPGNGLEAQIWCKITPNWATKNMQLVFNMTQHKNGLSLHVCGQ